MKDIDPDKIGLTLIAITVAAAVIIMLYMAISSLVGAPDPKWLLP